MIKFNHNYILNVEQSNGSTLTVTLPFTVEFDIIRNTLSSGGTCNIRIYNLSEDHRNKLRFNAYESVGGVFRLVSFQAGYGDNPPVVFQGNITQAWSVREGTNFVTTIQSLDGGFAFVNSRSNRPFLAKTARKTVLYDLIEDLDFVSHGVIGPSFINDPATGLPSTIPRGNTYAGDTASLLRLETNGGFFIDLGVAHCLSNNEYIQADDTVILNSSTGLLGTPVLEETIVHFDMLFEPSLKPGYAVLLDSITEKNYNGTYRITGVKHNGIISPAVASHVVTTGQFFYSKILDGVPIT